MLDGTEMDEENGVIKRLVERYVVSGLAGSGTQRLQWALDAVGCPQFNQEAAFYPHLLVTGRAVRPLRGADPDQADVFVTYTPKGLEGNNFYGVYGSSLTQIETQKDINGNPLSVSYQYPADYKYDPSLASETITQGGSISVQIPQATIMISGILGTDYPNSVTDYWMGSVNLWAWNGGGPGQWLVSSVTSEPESLGTNPSKWKFRFEFQRKLDGWQPVVFFTDPNDGHPPADLVVDVGVKFPVWYPKRIFQTFFP